MNCNIIKDLMPLYCDGQASEESRALIEEHLRDCNSCREIYESMIEIRNERCSVKGTAREKIMEERKADEAALEERSSVKDPFGKIRRRTMIRTGIISLLTASVIAAVFLLVFWSTIPAESKDCEITPRAYIQEGEEGEHWRVVAFNLKLTNGKCIDARSRGREDMRFENWMTVYDQYKIPFDDRGEFPGEMEYERIQEEPFADDDIMCFEFRDKTVEFNLKDIAEEAGIQ